MRIGIPLALVTFLAGEFVAPQAELLSQRVRAQARGDTTRVVAQQFQSGFWFKQDQTFVNIRSVLSDLTLVGVRIYEFDRELRLQDRAHRRIGHLHRQRPVAAEDGATDRDLADRDARDRRPTTTRGTRCCGRRC